MTIKELAQELGRSHQAVYKKLSKAGIDLNALKHPGTGEITAEGERIIRELYAPKQETETVPPPAVDHSSTGLNDAVEKVEAELKRLNEELTALRQDLADARHQTELAEMRATAAEGERDFLRAQLDNAIKANALASMKRLAPTEPQQKGLSQRIRDVWRNVWGKRQEPSGDPTEAE